MMDPNILIIYSSAIVVLVAIVGYFITKQINAFDRLTEVVAELNTNFALFQLNQTNTAVNCVGKHNSIDNRLKAHSDILHEHAEKITNIELGLTILKKGGKE